MKRLIACLLALTLAWGMAALAEESGAASPVGHVAAGEKHVVFLFDDGACAAFGDNSQGQCEVSSWKNVAAVAAGANYTVAVMRDGTCAAAGDNTWGQCDVGDWRGIVAVAAGANHTVGLRADGTCVASGIQATPDRDAWGEDEIVYDPRYNPCDVADWSDIRSIAAGDNLTAGLTSDGRVRLTGEDWNITHYDEYEDDGGVLHPYGVDTWENVRQIAVGPKNSPLALLSDGTVAYEGSTTSFNTEAWAACNVCNPGIDRFIDLDSRTISTWTDVVRLFTYGSDKTDAAGQCGVTFGLRSDGTILMAGEDTFGLIGVTKWTDIVDLAVGMGFVIGVKKDGTVLYTGKGTCLMPQMTLLDGLTDLSVFYEGENGYSYAVGVRQDGTLAVSSDTWANYFWDERVERADDKRGVAAVACAPDGFVMLRGDGTVESDYEGFAALSGLENIRKIAAGGTEDHSFALALSASGNVVSAGDLAVSWANVRDIAAGRFGAACVFQDGTVAAAGELANSVGDLSGWTDVIAAAVGDRHVIGLKKDGTCLAAGDNASGQCDVSAWKNVASVVAGARHTLALLQDGTCVAVGDETVTDYDGLIESRALDVSAWRDVAAVFACEGLSVGLKKDGGVLLAGMGTVNLSAATAVDLWEGVRERRDAPPDADSDNVRDILARISGAREDYAAVAAFVSARSALAQSILAAHPEYDDVWGEYLGLLLYKQDGLYGFLTPDGEVALKAEYEYIDRRPSGGMYVLLNQAGYGFADLTGALRVPCRYDATDGYDGYGYARVNADGAMSRKDGLYIDRDGRIAAANEEEYKAMIALLPAPADPVIGYVGTGSHADHDGGLEGYTDPLTGENVYPAFFDYACDFEDGIARVILANQDAYLNERFELLSEITLPPL